MKLFIRSKKFLSVCSPPVSRSVCVCYVCLSVCLLCVSCYKLSAFTLVLQNSTMRPSPPTHPSTQPSPHPQPPPPHSQMMPNQVRSRCCTLSPCFVVHFSLCVRPQTVLDLCCVFVPPPVPPSTATLRYKLHT